MSAPPGFDPADELTFPGDAGCFGCSRTNPVGLRLRFFRRGRDEVATPCTITDAHHGAPGVAHGGIVATILDEVSCAASFFSRGQLVVTGELSVRYRRPCPVENPIVASARIVDENPRYFVIEAQIRDGEEVLAHSAGKFFFTEAQTAP